MSTCVIVYSPGNDDLHLALSSEYAQALVRRLEDTHQSVKVFTEGPGEWDNLHQYLAAHLNVDGCVAFYTHGSIDHHGGYHCDVECHVKKTGRCSCAIGFAPVPIMTNGSAKTAANKHVYGATACFLGILFGPHAVVQGALGFVGYDEEFWHCRHEGIGTNPFEDVVNSGAVEILTSRKPEEVVRLMLHKYAEWINHMWGVGEEPMDWWLVELCLSHDYDALVPFSPS
jgi:hypothetical protein